MVVRRGIWYPWLERECLALGVPVINQTFPDNVKARARFWLPFLEELGADENTVLIGHSSGAVAAMRYAETHRLRGSILVSVCYTDLGDAGEAASGYYTAPWRWDLIRDHQQWIGVYHSTDDPHIPVSEPRYVAAQLKCSYFSSPIAGTSSTHARCRDRAVHQTQTRACSSSGRGGVMNQSRRCLG